MDEEIIAYQKYLLNFGIVNKPEMPKFDVLAYTDNEYLTAAYDCMKWFEGIDDEYLTIQHLKGD